MRSGRCRPCRQRNARRCAEFLLSPSKTRERLTTGLFLEEGANGSVAELERAFELVIQTASLQQRLRDGGCDDWQEALAKGLLSEKEAVLLQEVEETVARVVNVDDFAAEELGEMNFSPQQRTDRES